LFSEWHVQLHAAGESGAALTIGLALLPVESRPSALDLPTGAFGSNARKRMLVQAFDLLVPLLVAKPNSDGGKERSAGFMRAE
jgi:hypothetical protein